jgi:anti-repressor protein
MQLIIIQKSQGGKDVVSARELYDALGFNQSHWNRWAKKNIENNGFAVKNQDWAFSLMANADNQALNPNPTKDYLITIDFAKRLSMMARTPKGEEIRNYFIKCEEALKMQVAKPSAIELSRKDLALMILQAEEEKERMQHQIESMQPKAELYDLAMKSGDTLSMDEVAKILNLQKLGRNKIFELLRDKKVLDKNNKPYQEFVTRGWFKMIETPYERNGKTCIGTKTVVFQKGLDGIRKVIGSNTITN